MLTTDEQIGAWIDGELSPEDAARMAEQCRQDTALADRVERLRNVDRLFLEAVPIEDPMPAALLARLGLAEEPAANVVSLAAVRSGRLSRHARLAAQHLPRLAAGLAVITAAGVMTLMLNNGAPGIDSVATYRALSDRPGTAPAANGLIVFEPGVSEARMNAIAKSAGAKIVGPATETGARKLMIDPARRDAILARLRDTPRVAMAEPIDGEKL